MQPVLNPFRGSHYETSMGENKAWPFARDPGGILAPRSLPSEGLGGPYLHTFPGCLPRQVLGVLGIEWRRMALHDGR